MASSKRSAEAELMRVCRRYFGDVEPEAIPALIEQLYEDLYLEKARADILEMDMLDTNDIFEWVLNVFMVGVRDDHPHAETKRRIALKLANADATRVTVQAMKDSPRDIILQLAEGYSPALRPPGR